MVLEGELLMRLLLIPIMIAGLVAGADPPVARTRSRSPVIGIIDNSGYRYLHGCGCSLWSPGRAPDVNDPTTWKYLFLESYDKPRRPLMRIDGRIVRLRLVRSSSDADPRPGNPWNLDYSAPHLTVTIRGTVTELLDEGFVVRGTITVRKGGRRSQVRFEGDCGC